MTWRLSAYCSHRESPRQGARRRIGQGPRDPSLQAFGRPAWALPCSLRRSARWPGAVLSRTMLSMSPVEGRIPRRSGHPCRRELRPPIDLLSWRRPCVASPSKHVHALDEFRSSSNNVPKLASHTGYGKLCPFAVERRRTSLLLAVGERAAVRTHILRALICLTVGQAHSWQLAGSEPP